MEEQMEDFIEECYEEPFEIDEAYEFDASLYFDFTKQESDSDIKEAERWFEISGDYPPSPFIVKLNLGKVFSMEVVENSSNSKDSKNTKLMSSSSDVDSRRSGSSSKKNTKGASGCRLEDSTKSKTKSATKLFEPKSSTLMKPTASHLAKQNKLEDKCSNCVCTRDQKSSIKVDEKITQSPPRVDNLATKRQKLEIGYLRKVAQLKHQILLVHKLTKKVTVPKEPELVTMLRAQRRRSKNTSESSEHEKPKTSTSRSSSSNSKAPSFTQSKKKTEFQEFRFKTTERAMQHASSTVTNSHKAASHVRSGGSESKKETLRPEKHRTSLNSKSQKVFPSLLDDDGVVQDVKQDTRTLTESKIDSDNSLSQKPPTELFNKLSLRSDMENDRVPQPKKRLSNKGSGENVRGPFQPEFWKCHAKPNQCGGQMRVPETQGWSNNRRLGIS